jgi:FkbM family methyltransferase
MVMKEYIKSLIRKTPVYPSIRTYRERRAFRSFRRIDAARVAFYSQFITAGEIVFDVGANVGNRTKIFLCLKARVFAFEPQKQCADFLELELKREPNFTLVRKALGPREGEAEMFISKAHTLSTLSADWISTTQRSGRFSEYKWEKTQSVNVITLDEAIRDLGKPSFIKIDVEGYELEVLSGLSKPVNHISIEFVPEYLEKTFKCIDHINSISRRASFQLSVGESMTFHLPEWASSDQVKKALTNLGSKTFGDVYMRCN